MEKIVELSSDPYCNQLKRLRSIQDPESLTYILVTEHPNVFAEIDKFNTILAVEPRGGPRIEVGKELGDLGIVQSIYHSLERGYIIKL